MKVWLLLEPTWDGPNILGAYSTLDLALGAKEVIVELESEKLAGGIDATPGEVVADRNAYVVEEIALDEPPLFDP